MKNDQNVIIYSTLEQRSLPKKRKIELHAGFTARGNSIWQMISTES